MTPCYQLSTSIDSATGAARIAETLVAERLAACVQVTGPMTSVYRWEGDLQRSEEWLCTAKTSEAALPAAMRRIRALHTYEQPEILATLITAGDPGYLDWVRAESVSSSPPSTPPTLEVR